MGAILRYQARNRLASFVDPVRTGSPRTEAQQGFGGAIWQTSWV